MKVGTPEIRGNNAAPPLVYDRKQSSRFITLGCSYLWNKTWPYHPLLIPNSQAHTYTQIDILIGKVGEKIDVAVQSKTNFEYIITTMKLSKHKLIWANNFLRSPQNILVFFYLKNWKQYKCFLAYDQCFQYIVTKIPSSHNSHFQLEVTPEDLWYGS